MKCPVNEDGEGGGEKWEEVKIFLIIIKKMKKEDSVDNGFSKSFV